MPAPKKFRRGRRRRPVSPARRGELIINRNVRRLMGHAAAADTGGGAYVEAVRGCDYATARRNLIHTLGEVLVDAGIYHGRRR